MFIHAHGHIHKHIMRGQSSFTGPCRIDGGSDDWMGEGLVSWRMDEWKNGWGRDWMGEGLDE